MFSKNTTIADGLSDLVTVPFPYLARDHIHVYLDDIEVAVSELTWNSSTVLQVTTGVDAGTEVRVQRQTPDDTNLVVFVAGALSHRHLNETANQLLYVIQEAIDDRLLDVGVGDSVMTRLTVTDEQDGPITTFGASLDVYADRTNGITAAYVNQAIYSPVPSDFGVFYDVVRAVLVAPPGTTTPVQNGFGSWIINSVERDIEVSAFPNTSNYWGGSVADADWAGVWGMTLILTDHKGQVATANPQPRYLFGQEISLNFMSANSVGNGLQFTGQSLAGVTGVNAIALYHLDGFASGSGNRAKWASMLYSEAGSTNTFAFIGPVHMAGQVVASISSTTMTVSSVTSGVVSPGAQIDTPSGGYIVAHLTGTLGGVGTYQVSISQTFASGTIKFAANSQQIVFNAYKIGGVAAAASLQLSVFSQLQLSAPVGGSVELKVGAAVIAKVSAVGVALNDSVALATTAVGPFLAVTASAGPPTGIPTIASGGSPPLHYDTTNDKLWCYNSGWKFTQLA